MKYWGPLLAVPLICFATSAFAQAPAPGAPGEERSDKGTGDEIEQLFMKTQTQSTPAPTNAPAPGADGGAAPPAAELGKEEDLPASEKKSQVDLRKVSDLVQLSAFRDIAVIQKRYLPKTKRFEGYLGLSMVMNDPFFLSFGANGRLAYYLSERYGAEFVYIYLSTSEREVIQGLKSRGILTRTIVSPKSFTGLAFKWVPVYGKVTFLNQKITPFDLYFNFGFGATETNQGKSEPTFHLGAGQLFALSKAMAVRWDFTWNFFNSSGSGNASTSSVYNNLYLTVGMSFFFPKAKYR